METKGAAFGRLIAAVFALTFAVTPAVGAAERAALPAERVIKCPGDTFYSLDQGGRWTCRARKEFYERDQGSRIMPLRWVQALKQPDGQPFLADGLGRYGYLPNPSASTRGLPVGFLAAGPRGEEALSMTCAACHTRQIEVGRSVYRVDGGPAIVDFQSFLADLDQAVGDVLASEVAFDDFAASVLGPSPAPDSKMSLREAVSAWYERYHTLMDRALPTIPWGPSRLDAVAMIFNRVTGLDLGPEPSRLIPDNVHRAEAPARYPFLWNSPRQDKTQWPGFADNGNELLALSRNLGEVYGVFAELEPRRAGGLLEIDYLNNNSANFEGLKRLEDLVWRLDAPKWPWPIDRALARSGEALFEQNCKECHAVRTGAFRSPSHRTWATPIADVGTDSKEHELLTQRAKTGVLEGAPKLTSIGERFGEEDTAITILSAAVTGAIAQRIVMPPQTPQAARVAAARPEATQTQMFAAPTEAAYESRVLKGVWAAAPYLHNGSVPTLAELLKPASERIAAFRIGPAYDPVNVGLAAEQTQFDYTLTTTGCEVRNSGNSRCGHEYGAQLPEEDKQALLEYLKQL
jgi:cytochrome c5